MGSEMCIRDSYQGYAAGTFTADSFAIERISIDGGAALTAAEAGMSVAAGGMITVDTTVDAYQYLNTGEVADVVVHFTVTDDVGLSDVGTVTLQVAGADEPVPPTAKDFVSSNAPQPEDTVVTGLNFGTIYSDLVKHLSYAAVSYTHLTLPTNREV